MKITVYCVNLPLYFSKIEFNQWVPVENKILTDLSDTGSDRKIELPCLSSAAIIISCVFGLKKKKKRT